MNTTELNPVPELPPWLVLLIAALLLAVCGLAMAEEEPMKAGGVEIQVAEDGTPRFLVDLAAIDWKRVNRTKWYAKPAEFGRQVSSNTVENVKAHKLAWLVTALATYGVASGDASDWLDKGKDLIGLDDDKKRVKEPAKPEESPAVVIQGDGNVVETTNPDGVWVTGSGNSVSVNPYPNSQ